MSSYPTTCCVCGLPLNPPCILNRDWSRGWHATCQVVEPMTVEQRAEIAAEFAEEEEREAEEHGRYAMEELQRDKVLTPSKPMRQHAKREWVN